MGKKQSASTMRVNRNAERIHELALAEDPSVFDYDASYDQIQADKNVKVGDQGLIKQFMFFSCCLQNVLERDIHISTHDNNCLISCSQQRLDDLLFQVAKQKEADKNRKSKYAEDIIKAHQRREIEKQSREERKQQKERDDEGDEFADKEVYIAILTIPRVVHYLFR